MVDRAPVTLKGQALRWLAQREHSRQELAQRLRRWLQDGERIREAVHSAAGRDGGSSKLPTPSGTIPTAEDIDRVLDELQAQGLLSDVRFAESRIHARASRYGQRRIQQELRQRGTDIPQALLAGLKSTEVQRAHEVWSRRFSAPPATAADRARQARFLAGRGFSMSTILEVLKRADSGVEAAGDGLTSEADA